MNPEYFRSRQYDEEVLKLIKLRSSGWPWKRIAEHFQRSKGSVQRTYAAVMNEDIKYSGPHVRREYI